MAKVRKNSARKSPARKAVKRKTLARKRNAGQLDPALFSGRSLYLLPDGPAAHHPYEVLTEAMRQRRKWALGRMVLANHRQLVALHQGTIHAEPTHGQGALVRVVFPRLDPASVKQEMSFQAVTA